MQGQVTWKAVPKALKQPDAGIYEPDENISSSFYISNLIEYIKFQRKPLNIFGRTVANCARCQLSPSGIK